MLASAQETRLSGASHIKYDLPAIDKTPLEAQLNKATDELQTIHLLAQLADYYVQWEADFTTADSLLFVAVEIAKLSYSNQLMLQAYSNYLLTISFGHFPDHVKASISALENIRPQLTDPKDIWKCQQALSMGYHDEYDMDKAKDDAYQALTQAIQIKDQWMTANSYLLLGDILRETNNKLDAIRNYLNALTIAEAGDDMPLRLDCYDHLATFYNLMNAYDKSVNYKLKEIDLVEHALHPDSLRIMTLKFDMEVIAYNNRTLNEKQLYLILNYADRHKNKKLHQYCLIAFRNNLIKQNDFSQLYKLFHDQYPEDLAYLRVNDTTTYYRMQALFHEYLGNTDSAQAMYKLAAARIDKSSDVLRSASFYLRYGDYFERREMLDSATAKYQHAYYLANTIPYYTFMLEASDKLEKIYTEQQDYLHAYNFSVANRNISDSLDNMQQREQLQILELENEETLREQGIAKAEEHTRHRNNIQYNAITILIGSIFILLFLFGVIRVSPAIIRMTGFLCFIFFFEFIILLLDRWINEVTHEEPWKVLAIKILLMCGLLPLHHLIEKRVTHFLIHKKIRIQEWRFGLRGKKNYPIPNSSNNDDLEV